MTDSYEVGLRDGSEEARVEALEARNAELERRVREIEELIARGRGAVYLALGFASVIAWIIHSWDRVAAIFHGGGVRH